MDKTSLRRLKRADIQKLAKVNRQSCPGSRVVAELTSFLFPPLLSASHQRDGIRANQKTEMMIQALISKHAPSLVPFMDSIAPTTEQEAISKKILRRQGVSSIPIPAASPAVPSPRLRRNTRRGEAHPAPSTSAHQAPVLAPDQPEPESISSAPGPQIPESGRTPSTSAPLTTVDEILEAAVALSRTQVSAGPSMSASASQRTKVGETSVRSGSADLRARSSLHRISTRAMEKRKEVVSPNDNIQQGSAEGAGVQGHDRPAPTSDLPLLQRRVFFPPTQEQLEAMRARAMQPSEPPLAPLRVSFQFIPMPPRTSEQAQERTSASVSQRRLPPLPPLPGPPHVASMPSTRPSPPSPPSLPEIHVQVYRPPIAEARVLLNELGPVTDEDEAIRGFLGEMSVLLDHEEERAQDINQRLRNVQRLRLAMQELFFEKLKTDPRILAGTWVPDEAPQGQTESSGSGQQSEQRVEETMDSEESEIREVEEMTSRELMSSDLPSPPSQPSSKGKGKRRMPVDEDDSTDEDEEPESPCKRPRRS
ncbi:hypothetical protein ACG7TL_008776 [Trametes sanguinea]